MAAILIWLATISIGLLLIALTAALNNLALNAFLCALISLNFVILAMREHERQVTQPFQKLEVLAMNARYVGCNWAWMSLAVIVMHLRQFAFTGPMEFATGGLVAALISLGFARLIMRAAAARPERIGRLLKLCGMMSSTQLVGAFMLLALLLARSLGQGTRYDWPSVNVIAFGTVALAILTARALVALATPLSAGGAGVRPLPVYAKPKLSGAR